MAFDAETEIQYPRTTVSSDIDVIVYKGIVPEDGLTVEEEW